MTDALVEAARRLRIDQPESDVAANDTPAVMRPGSIVTFTALKQRADLNGKKGVVLLSHNVSFPRLPVLVLLDGPQLSRPECISVHSRNLRPSHVVRDEVVGMQGVLAMPELLSLIIASVPLTCVHMAAGVSKPFSCGASLSLKQRPPSIFVLGHQNRFLFTPHDLVVTKLSPQPSSADHQRARRMPVCTFSCGWLYATGGVSEVYSETQANFSTTVERYDVLLDRWEELPSLLHGSSEHGAAVVGDKLVVAAGKMICNKCQALDLSELDRGWRVMPSPSTPSLCMTTAAALDGFVYLVGGSASFAGNGREDIACVERFDRLTGTWAQVAPMNTARRNASVAVLAGCLYVVGGLAADGQRLPPECTPCVDTLERYDPQRNMWEIIGSVRNSVPTFPRVKNRCGLTAAGGQLFLLTFEGEEPRFDQYNVQSRTWSTTVKGRSKGAIWNTTELSVSIVGWEPPSGHP